MDEKGLKKIIQIITTILKLDKEGKLKTQGFNDRINVAIEIYERNLNDKWFIKNLKDSITEEMMPIYEIIIDKENFQ